MRASVEGNAYEDTLNTYIDTTVTSYMKSMFTYWNHIVYPKTIQNSAWSMALYWAFGKYTNAEGKKVVEKDDPPSVRVAKSVWKRTNPLDQFTMQAFIASKEFDTVPKSMKVYLAMNHLGENKVMTKKTEIETELLSQCSIPDVVTDMREEAVDVIRTCLDALYSLFKRGLFVPKNNFIAEESGGLHWAKNESWNSWGPFVWKMGRVDMLKMFVCLIHSPDSFMTMKDLGASEEEKSAMDIVLNSLGNKTLSRKRLEDSFEDAMGIMARAEKAATQIDTFEAEEHFKTELSRIKKEMRPA